MSRTNQTYLPQTKLRYVVQIVAAGVVAYCLALWAIDTAKLLVYLAAFVCVGFAAHGAAGFFRGLRTSSSK
jgi:hypothetical protein